MSHLVDLPAIQRMPTDELHALEGLMRFCYERDIEDLDGADFRAFSDLQCQAMPALDALNRAFRRLELPEGFLREIESVTELLRHRHDFRGFSEGPKYRPRAFSFAVDELPPAWQVTLRKFHALGTLDRMQSRLGMFAWSAQNVGLPVDLECVEALQAFYGDLRARSVANQQMNAFRNGWVAEVEVPRWAYLRGAWEELYRFARVHGCSEEVVEELGITLQTLQAKEAGQSALKMTKAVEAGSASTLLAKAQFLLKESAKISNPALRHAARNRAAAIAIGVAVPARPADVFESHLFGRGIFYEGDGYVFRYVPSKSRRIMSGPFEVGLDPETWSPFIDALILQDHDPRYLDDLRGKALSDQRPLYVNYNGARCVYSWYSRKWREATGTGGHISRTLIYDEMADLGYMGLVYSKAATHHVTDQISDKYRSSIAIAQSRRIAKTVMLGRGSDDDISDI